MKNLFNKLKNIKPDTTIKAYFKKAPAYVSNFDDALEPQIVKNISGLSRVILEGSERDLIMHKIRQTVFESQIGHMISPQVQNSCEVVHYAITNNIPVLVQHIKQIDPTINLQNQVYILQHQKIIDEEQYEKGLNEKKQENLDEIYIPINDNVNQSNYYDRQRVKYQDYRRKK